MIRIIMLFLVLGLMVGAIVAFGAIRSRNANKAEMRAMKEIIDVSPAYTFTAGQLYSAFLDDEEGANVAYGGQVVQISGIVDGLFGDANPPFVTFEGRGTWGVKCLLTEEEYDEVRAVEGQKSKRLIMKGRVEKRTLYLRMRGCTLLGTEAMAAPSVFGP